MKEIISPVIMNGSSRRFLFKDVKGYKKTVELITEEKMHLTYTRVRYDRGSLSYVFHLIGDKIVFFKLSFYDYVDVTYEEFEKFCKVN